METASSVRDELSGGSKGLTRRTQDGRLCRVMEEMNDS